MPAVVGVCEPTTRGAVAWTFVFGVLGLAVLVAIVTGAVERPGVGGLLLLPSPPAMPATLLVIPIALLLRPEIDSLEIPLWLGWLVWPMPLVENCSRLDRSFYLYLYLYLYFYLYLYLYLYLYRYLYLYLYLYLYHSRSLSLFTLYISIYLSLIFYAYNCLYL
jgi:hypothetical protein